MRISHSKILMASLFATGIAGIVSEYVLATLATYFLGNSVFQWTMILSIMLFSMGLGSRSSKLFKNNLIEVFIGTELILSLVTSFCALFIYSLMGMTKSIELFIYGTSVVVGFLIGLEIPLVTRINDQYQDLSLNISNVMEKDYYGSLIGGIFFAFIGLPFLGLSYTPFILGSVNLIVALLVLAKFYKKLNPKFKALLSLGGLVLVGSISVGSLFAKDVILYGEQKRFLDKIIYSEQTKFQKITLTKSKTHHVLYLNNSLQLNTMDEWLYHEPLVHTPIILHPNPKNVLILGGGDGCAIREVLKYESVESVKLVDLDPKMTDFGANHPVFATLNDSAFHDEKVQVVNEDAFIELENDTNYYDIIIVDFPDPRTIELSRLYTKELYAFAHKRLRKYGVIITQSTSPYFQTKAFYCIKKTLQAAGFNTAAIHNHVQSFGEWGWVIGSKHNTEEQMLQKLRSVKQLPEIETRWLNKDALKAITYFGKPVGDTSGVEVNGIHQPVLFKYYIKGTAFNQAVYE